MMQPVFNMMLAMGGLGLTFGLGLSGTIAQETPLPITTESNFLDWLRNPDQGAPPNSPRPLEGFCLVSLTPGIDNQLWSDRPVFLIQGEPRSLALYREGNDAPIWTYPVNTDATVTYTGVPLRPGVVYTLRAEHAQFPSSQYEERQLVLVSTEEQVAIALDLLALEEEMQQAGAMAEAIAIAKADLLWQQGLATDAWDAVWALQAESSEVAAAIATGVDALCNPTPVP